MPLDDVPENPPPSLESQLRSSLDRILESLQLRLALLGTEWEAEKLRLFSGLAGLLLCLVLGAVGLGLLSLALVWLLPTPWQWLMALGLAALYGLGAWAAWRWALARLSAPSGLFEQSLAELQRDRALLRGGPDV
ncbi:phage holin family protein [Roseateles sp. DB2]|uniref:phage holin family protein n=1 Tax=Roseateles sp. DB2 TaxID=3453717 RepID=UPI003EE9F32C